MASELRVMIATAGRPRLLQRTLDSLAECERPSIYRETIVIENGPPMGARDIVEACPKELAARYVHVERANKSNALNVAMQDVPDPCLIFFSDDDVRFAADILTQYAHAAEECEEGFFYGGPVEVDYEVPPLEWVRPHLPASAVGWEYDEKCVHDRSVVFLGMNWAAFVGDIRQAGQFDLRFGPGGSSGSIGQEANMQQSLLKVGVRPQYVASARVWHFVPAERCTPRWTLERQFRAGLKQGLLSERHALSLLGFLRWRSRIIVKPTVAYLCTRLALSPKTRYAAQARLWFILGVLRGSWLARNQLCEENRKSNKATSHLSPEDLPGKRAADDSIHSSG